MQTHHSQDPQKKTKEGWVRLPTLQDHPGLPILTNALFSYTLWLAQTAEVQTSENEVARAGQAFANPFYYIDSYPLFQQTNLSLSNLVRTFNISPQDVI